MTTEEQRTGSVKQSTKKRTRRENKSRIRMREIGVKRAKSEE